MHGLLASGITVLPVLGYGNLLREARLSAGLTQAELAEKVGVDRTIVSKVERERISLTVAQVNALVQALPISAEQLLRAMGVHLTPPAAARLPRELVGYLLDLDEHRGQVA